MVLRRVVIAGAGISGLALAYRLGQRRPDAEVTVLERGGRVGGCIATAERDGFRVEAGPNGFLDSKPTTLALCRDLGLGDRLVAASAASRSNRFVLLGGRLRALPAGFLSFLFSGVLSWRAKFALLTERYRPGRPGGDDESVDAFVRRRVGDEIADTLADAFVTGIYAGDPRLLSVRAAFPRLAGFEREHGSVWRGMAQARRQRRAEAAARGEPAPGPATMWSFREGLGLLVARLRDRLPRPPLLGAVVRSLRPAAGEAGLWEVVGEGQERWRADAVVLTCPAYEQAAHLAELDPGLAAEVAAIAYNRIVVIAVGYRAADVPRRLDGFGYLTPQREHRDVLGVQWCSSIFPDRAPPGLVLLRALCGGWRHAEMVDWDEERLLTAVRAELAQTLGVTAAPVFHHVVYWPRAIPQYHLGHLDRLARIEERLRTHPGLYLGGNAFRGVALNDCVEQADLLAARLATDLPAP